MKRKIVLGKGKYRHYKVIESESPKFPVGMEFLSKESQSHFADIDCNDVKCKLIHWCDGHPEKTADN